MSLSEHDVVRVKAPAVILGFFFFLVAMPPIRCKKNQLVHTMRRLTFPQAGVRMGLDQTVSGFKGLWCSLYHGAEDDGRM